MRSVGVFVLLLLIWGIATLFYDSLTPKEDIGNFKLPSLFTESEDLNSESMHGKPYIINFFASWCTSCRAEHELWMKISCDQTVQLYGVSYLDTKEKTLDWLANYGNPYKIVGMDYDGSVSRKLKIKGVPETFVFDAKGNLKFHISGAIDLDIWKNRILPMLKV